MKIQSVQHTLKILNLFTYAKPRWGINEITTTMNLPKGTVSNIVHTLVEEGMLTQDPETRKYNLGLTILSLGTIMAGTLEINQKAGNPARQLAGKTGLICRVAVWDRNVALVTFDILPDQVLSWAKIGPGVVAYCSSLGRTLLAYLGPDKIENYFCNTNLVSFTPQTITIKEHIIEELEQTRIRGYGKNNQEMSLGRGSIAAPIFNARGEIYASISLTGNVDHVFGKKAEGLVTDLQNTAAEISQYMGYYPLAPGVVQSDNPDH
ncbi:MAG: IclR family transcriptional regulator [Proteobacteria bacterium]|nr:IclR family transcriptional regulator [Pseudomonadota bacterium]